MSMLTLISDSGLIQDSIANPDKVILFGVKTMFVVAGIIYLLFAILVTRQIAVMSRTIPSTASLKIKLLGLIHLLLSVFVLIYFFIVL
jgi:hypothetical protein